MIYFSDKTIIDGHGNYKLICEIMQSEGPPEWMLKSTATVSCPVLSADFMLHLWYTGEVVIMESNHPVTSSAPDDDLRELSKWCVRNGWQRLSVSDRLVQEHRDFEFWLRLYYAGIIHSSVLQKHDEDEIKRMSETPETDEEEDEL